MIPAFNALNVATSGLDAASKRVYAAAQNIANQYSTQTSTNGVVQNVPYQPQDVVQLSQAGGGVVAQVVNDNSAPVPVYQPQNPAANAQGIVQYPNVSAEQNLVGLDVASSAFQANLDVIKVQQELDQNTLDIIA